MRVVLSPRAEKELRKLPKVEQIAVAQKIRSIREAVKVIGEEKLAGFQNIFRVRIGDYRIVYQKIPQEIYIILIRHRKDIYRLLKQFFR